MAIVTTKKQTNKLANKTKKHGRQLKLSLIIIITHFICINSCLSVLQWEDYGIPFMSKASSDDINTRNRTIQEKTKLDSQPEAEKISSFSKLCSTFSSFSDYLFVDLRKKLNLQTFCQESYRHVKTV